MTKLLIVDDKQENLYMLQVLLSANGFKVELATNGAEALERARRAPPDLIISDILMPVMDGFALCRAWKEDARLKHIPFVFYTATYTDPKDEDFALSLGAERFIVKPVEPDKFLAILLETIETHKAGQAATPYPTEEAIFYKEYNAALIRKLEDKMLQLGEANRNLERGIAEIKRAEEALRASEERYRTLFNSMGEGLMQGEIIESNGGKAFDYRILDVNPAVQRILGKKAQELIGKTLYECFPDSKPETVERLVKLGLTGRPVHFETSSEDKWFDVTLFSPGTNRLAAVFFDISERKRAEESLRESEARAKLLSETAGKLLTAENPQRIVEELCRDVMSHLDCQAFFNFLGDEAVERLHLNAWAGIPEEEARKIEWLDYGVAVSGCAARDGCRIVAEHIPTTPDVRTELVRSYGIKAYACHPLLGPGRKVIGTLSFGTRNREAFSEADLSLMKAVTDQVAVAIERMKLIGELQRSRDELEVRVQERTAEIKRQAELINLSRDAILVKDLENRIVFWSKGAEEVYGWTKEEALGKTTHSLLKTQFPIPIANLNAEFLAKGHWEGELVHTRKEGQKLSILSRWALQRDENGKPSAVLEINIDITDRKRMEEQLRHAQRMEALGTLAGGIAHDFNNLLTPILLNTELALMDVESRTLPSIESLRLVEEGANRGRELVKQIIVFSRHKGHTRNPIEISSVIKEGLKLLKSTVLKQFEIRTQLEAGNIVLADPVQIHQVLMNLCLNAAHAMREKDGILEVTLAKVEAYQDQATAQLMGLRPGPYVQLTVKDNGHGMPPEVREKAFDPFFTTKRKGEGSGMGLAVVHGIVKKHEGAIQLESEEGKGTAVNIFLPLIPGEPKESVFSALEEIPKGKERILFVDDEKSQVSTVQSLLERLGYIVTAEMDPRRALDLFRSQPDGFDLVISDQVMPHLQGDRLSRELLDIRPDIPIILCTGFSEEVDEDKAKAAGIREFILKPFTLKEMAEMIRKVLRPKRKEYKLL